MKKYIWWIIAAVIVAGVIFWFGRTKNKAGIELVVKVEQGDFEILVAVTGELQAKNAENIYGPNIQAAVWRWAECKILDLIPEGTLVEAGDYVAEIDRAAAKNAISDLEERIDRHIVLLETTRLDTALNLRGLRDDLLNRESLIEEQQLKLESAIYEPPATIRALEYELERSVRALDQQRRLYAVRLQHNTNWMRDMENQLNRYNQQLEQMNSALSGFTVRAPRKGMVIYRRERNGQKRRAGANINPSDNVVATLPDLSMMLSKVYVNEIDISKVKVGQQVRIGVDAFPEKKYTGAITEVANVGEQLAGADAKVFEVVIEVKESDLILRPSMTTSNQIVISTLPDVTYLSIDAIYTHDSIPFVYTAKQTKQIVVLGDSNDNEIVVEQGLSKGDMVYVTVPENSGTWLLVGEELIPVIRERALEKKKAQEELDRKANEQRRAVQQQRGQRADRGQRQDGGGGQQSRDGGDQRQGGGQRSR